MTTTTPLPVVLNGLPQRAKRDRKSRRSRSRSTSERSSTSHLRSRCMAMEEDGDGVVVVAAGGGGGERGGERGGGGGGTRQRRPTDLSTRFIKAVSSSSLIFESESSDEEDDVSYETFSKSREKKASSSSRFLNMVNTFLYMMNTYIVAPTSGTYASMLHCTPAFSGIIIGMTPVAALVSAVLYSWWANRSFKSPLVFASVCLIGGNLLYALALTFNSMTMVMCGRLLTGFGGARVVNRRYISDNYSKSERTAASAMFVSAGALGMAAGPASAVVLSYLPDLSIFGVAFTAETSPGWLMFVVWTIYLVCLALLFEEPDRLDDHVVVAAKASKAVSETTALTSSVAIGSSGSPEKEAAGLKVVEKIETPTLQTTAILLLLWIYFIQKLVLECLLSSCTIIGTWYFGWSLTASGLFLALLGLLMFPASMLLSYLCYRYQDREIIMFSEVFTLVGILGLIAYSASDYTVIQYVVFGVFIFVFTNILEGVNMSLLSKKVPRSWARGTFNSSLLATEAGTFGRALGDYWITLVGLYGIDKVLNYTFVPMAALMLLTVAWTYRSYSSLVNDPEDDEK